MSKISSPDSSTMNSTELIARYLQAVRFWVPKSHRQEDLLTELGEDLRSQIEDKEAELGHTLEKTEIAAILRRCGSPMMVAARLGPQRHLIGPALFPIYEFVLKMVLLWILVPVFIFIVGPVNVAYANGNWPAAILNTFGNLWSGLFIAAGIITLVFAIVERTSAHVGAECKWDPLKLPPVRKQENKLSPMKVACELGFGFFGLVWLLLLPKYPVLILGPAAAFLKAGPILHMFFVPFVFLSIAGLLRSAVTLARPQWTWVPLASQLLNSVLALIVLHYMVQAITRSPNSYPFVAVKDALSDAPKYFKLAAIVNASLLLSLGATWLGMCIALVTQTWQFMRYLRNRISAPRQIVSLGVH